MFFLLALCTKSIYILNSGSTQGYTRESTEPKNPKQSTIFKKRGWVVLLIYFKVYIQSNVLEWSCLKGSCSRVKKILQQILVFDVNHATTHIHLGTHIYNCTIFPFLKHKHCEVPDGSTLRKKVDGYFFWSKEMIGLFLHPEEQQSPCAFNNKTLTLYVWVIIPHGSGTLYDLAL